MPLADITDVRVVQSGGQAILQIRSRDQKIQVPGIMLESVETMMQLRDELAARVARDGEGASSG